MDVWDDEGAIRAFMDDGGLTLPVMLAADDVANLYGVRAVPTLVVIDSEGRIAKTIVGGAAADDLSALVDDLTH
jgi:thioredoxin-related protein